MKLRISTIRHKHNGNYLLCFLYVFLNAASYGQDISQDQVEIDSLKQVYTTLSNTKDKRKILTTIVQDETDPEEKLKYTEILIQQTEYAKDDKLIKQDSLLFFRSIGFLQKGNALQLKGEFHEAIDA